MTPLEDVDTSSHGGSGFVDEQSQQRRTRGLPLAYAPLSDQQALIYVGVSA